MKELLNRSYMIRLFLFISIFSRFCLGNDNSSCDPILGIPMDQDNLLISEAIISRTNVQLCSQHEEQFREFLLNKIRGELESWEKLLACQNSHNLECRHSQNIINSTVNSISVYRDIRQRFYQNIAQTWYDNLPRSMQTIASDCFIDRDEVQQVVELGEHFRTLRIQNGVNPTLCMGVLSRFEGEITGLERQAQESPEAFGVSGDYLSKVADFENSNGAIILSQETLGRPNLTESELRSSVINDYSIFLSHVRDFTSSVSELPVSQLDQLYIYNEIYEREFIPSLDEENRNTYYPLCFQNRTGECGRTLTMGSSSETDLMRCYSDVSNFILDLIPGRSAYRAAENYQQVNTSRVLGVLSSIEAHEINNRNDIQLVLGLPVLDLAGLGMAENVGSAFVRSADGIITRISDEIVPTGQVMNNLAPNISPGLTNHTVNAIKRELSGGQDPQELDQQPSEENE